MPVKTISPVKQVPVRRFFSETTPPIIAGAASGVGAVKLTELIQRLASKPVYKSITRQNIFTKVRVAQKEQFIKDLVPFLKAGIPAAIAVWLLAKATPRTLALFKPYNQNQEPK